MPDESQFRLRIPAPLRAKVEAAAREAGRSLNAQVLVSLEKALGEVDEIADLQGQISDLETRLIRAEINISTLAERAGMWPKDLK